MANALHLGSGEHAITVDPPVVLAPMAGVTNPPYRTLCRSFGGGLFTSEMVGARGLYEALLHAYQSDDIAWGKARTLLRAGFGDDEPIRSLQLYSTNPTDMGRAVDMLTNPASIADYVRSLPAKHTGNQAKRAMAREDEQRAGQGEIAPSGTANAAQGLPSHHASDSITPDQYEDLHTSTVDHIDINMGCPATKITRHGGGAALPYKHDYALSVVQAAIANAHGIPVTVKTRLGIDDDHIYVYDFAQACQDLGASAITVHGRTAYQAYGGHADWEAIARVKAAVSTMPVLGNGDIWAGVHAKAMMDQTGCDGVVVGRGCLGRPWLFRDIEAALAGQPIPAPPTLGEVMAMLIDHAKLLAAYLGVPKGLYDIRKHAGWYLQGFPVGPAIRTKLTMVESVQDVIDALAPLDPSIPMPPEAVTMHRGHGAGNRPVKLPEGWLDSRDFAEGTTLDEQADSVISGG